MLSRAELKAVRLILDETQAKFGVRFGVDQVTIHRWETLGIPKVGTARKAVERFEQDFRAMYPGVEITAVGGSNDASSALND